MKFPAWLNVAGRAVWQLAFSNSSSLPRTAGKFSQCKPEWV